jgi:putative NADH-flavin reductase
MKVALIGATGSAGSRILTELVNRGHVVIGMARHIDRLPSLPGVSAKTLDANDQAALTDAVRGCDAVVSSVKFKETNTQGLIDAIRASSVKRYIVVGGAGSLKLPDGGLEMESPRFPAFVLPEAKAGASFLKQLQATADLDWTYISPSRFFNPGERTGRFRLGTDTLLSDASGKSAISQEDYAIALVDELEQPRHVRQRYTVGY